MKRNLWLAMGLALLFLLGAAAGEETVSCTVSFLGDCSIGDAAGSVNRAGSYHACIKNNGVDWPFSLVKSWLEADDLTVANLEVVLTEREKHVKKMFPLRGKPEFTEVLKAGSIEAVNTVNNHCEDFYRDGYADTRKNLEAGGVLHFGTLRAGTSREIDDLLVRDLNGIRIGLVGFTYPQIKQENIAERIRRLKEEEGCDIVVVSLHWGREEHNTPGSGQAATARKILDAGADMIYGHHPHVLQQIHFYNGKPVLYSTGNFTFGTMSRVDPATGIFQMTWEKTGGKTELRQLRVIPCHTTYSPDFRPTPCETEEEKQKVWAKLRFKKNWKGMTDPPESFLTTGVVTLRGGEFTETGREP